MNQQALELREHTRKFASAVITFCEARPVELRHDPPHKFSIRCSRSRRITRFAAKLTGACTTENPASSLILQPFGARLSAGDSSVGRKRGAAIVGVPQVSFPALAATGRRFHTRPAAKPVRWGRREAWRLDLRVLSSKTARTVARDGCKQGLAVYSVRS